MNYCRVKTVWKSSALLGAAMLLFSQGAYAQDLSQEERIEQAQAQQQELLAQFKESADAGQVHLDNGDFDNSILALSRALQIAKQFEKAMQQQGALNNQWTDIAIPSVQTVRAKAFAGAKEYQAALKDYKEVLDVQEKNLPALIGRGQLYLDLGAVEAAYADFSTAIEEDRTNHDILFGLGTAQVLGGQMEVGAKNLGRALRLSGIETDDFDDYLRSMTEEEQAELVTRKFQKLFRLRGQALAGQQKFAEGLADMARSLRIDPNDHETYLAKGIVLLQAEQYDPSIAAIQEAIDHYEPGDDGLPYSQGYLTKAAIHMEAAKKAELTEEKTRHYQAIVSDCDTLLSLLEGPKTTTDARSEEATLEDSLELAGNAGGDETALNGPKKFNPASLAAPRANAYYSRGVALRMMDEWAAAIDSFSQAIDNNPDLGEAYFRRGICFHYIDEDDLAIADFELSAVIDFQDPRARLWQGFSYAEVGDHYEAVRAFSKAIEQSERFTPAYINRGLVYMQIGEYERAVADFNETIRLEPSEAEHYFKRGLAYSLIGNSSAAERSFKTALALNPDHEDAQRRLGQGQ